MDLTNSIPSSKRQCLKKAQESITKQTGSLAPRAQPQKGAETRELNKRSTVAGHVENVESMTLQGIKKERPYIFKEGGNRLEQYIHDNTTIEIRKAFALSVFQKAITDRNMKVMEAAKTSAQYTAFAAEVIRRWAMSCSGEFFATISCLEDIEDEELSDALSSNRGCYTRVVSLINDETFTLEAAKFVRAHGYRKREPNLTLDKFVEWVKDKHGKSICISTASAWLHMGFGYKQFSKGVYFDGHDRQDVVEYRDKYSKLMEKLGPRMITYNRSEIQSAQLLDCFMTSRLSTQMLIKHFIGLTTGYRP